MKKTIRYPLRATDVGDDKVDICDGEGTYILYGNTELKLNQWQFIVEVLNDAGRQGKFIPLPRRD